MVTPSVIDILCYDISFCIVNCNYVALNVLAEVVICTVIVEANGSNSCSVIIIPPLPCDVKRTCTFV